MIRKGHFRVNLCRERVLGNYIFSTLFVTVSRVTFPMLSETALNEQSYDFVCQNDSEMRFKIDAKTDMVKSSDLLLFTTLWNDVDL